MHCASDAPIRRAAASRWPRRQNRYAHSSTKYVRARRMNGSDIARRAARLRRCAPFRSGCPSRWQTPSVMSESAAGFVRSSSTSLRTSRAASSIGPISHSVSTRLLRSITSRRQSPVAALTRDGFAHQRERLRGAAGVPRDDAVATQQEDAKFGGPVGPDELPCLVERRLARPRPGAARSRAAIAGSGWKRPGAAGPAPGTGPAARDAASSCSARGTRPTMLLAAIARQ